MHSPELNIDNDPYELIVTSESSVPPPPFSETYGIKSPWEIELKSILYEYSMLKNNLKKTKIIMNDYLEIFYVMKYVKIAIMK